MPFHHLSEIASKTEVDLLTPNSLSPYLKPYIYKEIEYVSLSH